MRKVSEDSNYDTSLEASDWRFSAAIVGLMEYFKHHNIKYEKCDDFILYNESDITEERYIKFVEKKYGEKLHHKSVEIKLKKDEFSSADIKEINDKLKANSIMKKIFSKIKFDGTNKEEILDIIDKNRFELIKETYRTKTDMYANFANTNQMLKESQSWCRLVGYNIDAGKKGKSVSYNFNMNTFISQDCKEFDFIPFAFSGDFESFFINDNFTIKRLKISNKLLKDKLEKYDSDSKAKSSRQKFFKAIIESSDFIKRDIEVIVKDRDKAYFETLYIRKKSIDILKALKENKVDYEALNISYKVNERYYRNIQKEVMECILNNIVLDNLIELYLKNKNSYIVSQLIKINILMRGEKGMKDKLKGAFACAKKVAGSIEQNKIDSYRQKLTSSIVFKDYDRACQILLQLSNYSNVEFGFVYDLFDDFENNKDLAYTFINALSKENKKNNNENN